MNLNFSLSEFNISGEPIPQDVADKILQHHILPMQIVRDLYGEPIWPSQRSGYRSPKWEKDHGRSGASQHCFETLGAVDWTSNDLDELERLIIEHTEYRRITRYSTFIHCDYKAPEGVRRYYTSGSDSKWKFVKNL